MTVQNLSGPQEAINLTGTADLLITGTNAFASGIILNNVGCTLELGSDYAVGVPGEVFTSYPPNGNAQGRIYMWDGSLIGVGGPRTISVRQLLLRSSGTDPVILGGTDLTFTQPVYFRHYDNQHYFNVENTTTFADGIIEVSTTGNNGVRFHKGGTGTLIISGSCTYTGEADIDAGTVRLATASALDTLPSGTPTVQTWQTGAAYRVAAGAELALNVGGSGEFTQGNVLTLVGTSTFVPGSTLALDTTNAAGGSFAMSGNIGNGIATADIYNTATPPVLLYAGNKVSSLGLAKVGPNSLILSGTNSYTGGTTVDAGTLAVTNATALPAGTSLTVARAGRSSLIRRTPGRR